MSTELLTAILERIERIESRLSAPAVGPARALSTADSEALTKLLPAIRRALGGANWTTADLIEHAELRDAALHTVLNSLFGGHPNRRAIGKLLARGAGAPVGAFSLSRVASCREGVLWRVDS